MQLRSGVTQYFSQSNLIYRGGNMRIITIKVSETNNGEHVKIDVSHFSVGKHLHLELETIKILNEFVFMKVDELSCPQDHKQLLDLQFQQNEVAN